MAVDLQTVVDRWSASGGTAQSRYTEGVQNTQVDVVARAIAAEGALLSGFQTAVTSGLWRRKLGAVGTPGWKAATLAKSSNYASGFTAGKDKFASSMQTWYPRILSAAAMANAMPGGTFQERMARAQAYATTLHNQKLQG